MLDNMDEDEDNVYMTSIHDRYAAHQNNLEGICLAKFAVNYEPLLNSGGNDEGNNIFEHAHDSDDEGNNNDDLQESNIITLKILWGKCIRGGMSLYCMSNDLDKILNQKSIIIRG